MQSEQIRKKFLDFYTSPPRDHKVIPNISLVPLNDPSLLFVNSGMFPLVPYLMGEKHPQGKRLVNFQRSIRFEDLEEVGDNRHTTFFEMMGNWSLNDFFKKEQLPWCFEFLVDELGLDINRLYVSVFAGNKVAERDEESINLWKQIFKKYGVKAEVSEDIYKAPQKYNQKEPSNLRIFKYTDKNWWLRAEAKGELGGTTSEVFYETELKHDKKYGDKCHLNCDCGHFIEIANNVFMEYFLDENMKWKKMKVKNVDVGWGFERITMFLQNKNNIFESDLFESSLKRLEEISGKKFNQDEETKHNFTIVLDHIRGATFILADGVIPSNKEQGYILRRLIRRMIRFGRKLGIQQNFTKDIAIEVIKKYTPEYPHLKEREGIIIDELEKEEIRFNQVLVKGMKNLEEWTNSLIELLKKKQINKIGETLYDIYATYGMPQDIIIDEMKIHAKENQIKLDRIELDKSVDIAKQKHQEISRHGMDKKFRGGLADTSEITVKYHTLTHLLLKALQTVLGPDVHQKGSNITSERLRFDFSYGEKLSNNQISEVEKIVNKAITDSLTVEFEKIPYNEAKKRKAEGVFAEKYGEFVKVYKIWNPETGKVFSYEICGGPHVKYTRALAVGAEHTLSITKNNSKMSVGAENSLPEKKTLRFKITKEESSGSGVRRIKGILE